MSRIKQLLLHSGDTVRLVQVFMLCRQTGVILSSVVIARLLPLEEVGIFEMLMLCGYLMTFFWSDALLKGYLSIMRTGEDDHSPGSFFWVSLIMALLAMALLLLGKHIFIPLFVNRQVLPGLEFFAVYQALIITVWITPFTGLIKGWNYLLLSAYVLIGPAFACWAGLARMADLTGALIGLLSYALVGFGWVLATGTWVHRLRIRSMLFSLWPATWPLVMYAVSMGVSRSFDAWLVARHFDESVFAVFRYGAREFPLVMALAAGLSLIMIPRLRTNEHLDELRMRSARLMHLCYPVTAAAILVSPVLFELFFGPAYRQSALIFNIYLLLTLTQLVFPQSIMTARGDAKLLWYISLAELLINIAASLFLLKVMGLVGIAWGTLIAFAFEKVILILILHRRYGIMAKEILPGRLWLGYALLLLVCFIASKWIFGI